MWIILDIPYNCSLLSRFCLWIRLWKLINEKGLQSPFDLERKLAEMASLDNKEVLQGVKNASSKEAPIH